jgi:hypothetical protein
VPVDGGAEHILLETAVYRPSGPGPFPLVTINHGKPRRGAIDPSAMRPGFDAAAHLFIDLGFAVAVPSGLAMAALRVRSATRPVLAATAITLLRR